VFEFLHGWLALGALGGSVPVIIHLLNRRRFRVTRWAAMEFLLASLKKNYRRVRFENLLLLLLRVLMVVLLALALARPRLLASGALLGGLGPESRHVILVLDESLSMRHREGDRTAFDRAKAAAETILASLRKGDVVSLLAMSDVARPVVGEATLEIDVVRSEVKRAEPGWGGTDARAALVAAAGLLDSTRKPRKDIFILTDMQARAWGVASEGPDAELRAALDRVAKQAQLFVIDVGSEDPQNLAATALRPLSGILGVDSPSEFRAEVTNFGRSDQAARVRCLVDRFNQGEKALDVPAGETGAAGFSHTFRTTGAHLVQAQLGDDRLAADNIRHLAARVERFLPVLLVNGETSTDPEENETYFLERALKPPADDARLRVSHVEPTTITEFGLSATDFVRYRVVVLANLPSLAAENAVPRLEDYVRDGGALVIFPGDRVDATFYNEQLFKQGRGLLPAALGPEVGSAEEDAPGVRLELVKPVHPAFQRFAGDRAIHLTRSVLFRKHLRLELPDASEDLRVVARFENGSPAAVEKTFGRGRVMLFASSCDTEWNNFAKAPAYVVVMHDLLSYLASGDFETRNITVREPYRRVFAPEELAASVTVRPPHGPEKKLRPHPVRSAARREENAPAGLTEIVFADTHAAGVYELELERMDGSRAPVEYFAVNPPPDESDLRRTTPEQLRALLKGVELEYAKSTDDLTAAVREARTGRDITRALLLGVLGMACVELILGQRFGR